MLGAKGEFWGRAKLVFHPFAGAVSGFPTVCRHEALQTFVLLAEDGEGRKSSGCGICLVTSQAVFVGAVVFNTMEQMGPAVVRAIEMLSVHQFSQLFPVFQLSSSPS